MDIFLPRLLRLEWCASSLLEFPWDQDSSDGYVRFCANEPIGYVDPAALAMVGAWAQEFSAQGNEIEIDESVRGLYAWKSGLLSALAGRFNNAEVAENHWFAAQIRHEFDIENTLFPLRTVLHLDEQTTEALIYCVSEMLRNVFEHSGSLPGAYLCASHFPKTTRVSFCVVDIGMTVQAHVVRRLPDSNIQPIDALRMALEPGVSGSRDSSRNAGLGLYMVRRMAELVGGTFWLLSGNLHAQSQGNGTTSLRNAPTIRSLQHQWPGTSVVMTLHENRLTSFKDEIRRANMELRGKPTIHDLDIFRKEPPLNSVVVVVPPDISTLAQNKVAAVRIRDEEIMVAINAGLSVCLDFTNVVMTTQSFMHALLATPLRTIGARDLRSRISFVGASTYVKNTASLVIGYISAESQM